MEAGSQVMRDEEEGCITSAFLGCSGDTGLGERDWTHAVFKVSI